MAKAENKKAAKLAAKLAKHLQKAVDLIPENHELDMEDKGIQKVVKLHGKVADLHNALSEHAAKMAPSMFDGSAEE